MSSLLSKEQLEQLPDLYETESQENPIFQMKIFTPYANFTWFLIEISKQDFDTCFGYVQGLESELGYFSLKELESIRGSLGLPVEVDNNFEATSLLTIKKGI